MSNAWKFTHGPNFETIKIVKFPCKCLRSVNPIKPGFKWIHTGMILWILCMLFWCTWAKRKWETPLGSHLFWQVVGQVKQKNNMKQNSTQQNKTSKCFWHLERLSLLMCPYFFKKKKDHHTQPKKNTSPTAYFGTWTCWICHSTPWTFRPRIGYCQLLTQEVPPDRRCLRGLGCWWKTPYPRIFDRHV